MNALTDEAPESLTEAETERRRDEVVKRMLATPPQPKRKTDSPAKR